MIPRLCQEILKRKDKWIPKAQSESLLQNLTSLFGIKKAKRQPPEDASPEPSYSEGDPSSMEDVDENVVCPIIRYSSFEERVRSIDPLASTNVIRIAGNYLQDMGEVSRFTVLCSILVPYYMNLKNNDSMSSLVAAPQGREHGEISPILYYPVFLDSILLLITFSP